MRRILGSTTHADRSQSDRVFSTGRCPFPENIDGGIHIALMRDATGTGPHPVTQRDEGIEGATDMTELARRKPWIDMPDHGPRLVCHLMQNLDEGAEAQVR